MSTNLIQIVNKVLGKEFIKFAIVGIINTAVGTAIMFSMYNLLHYSYWISSATNYILTSVLSFFLNKYFTFEYKGDVRGSAIRFAINIALCYLLAYGIAKPLTFYAIDGSKKLKDNIAMIVGMCFFVGFNYFGQRFFAFKVKKEENSFEDKMEKEATKQ